MTRPNLARGQVWQPVALSRLAESWDDVARVLQARVGAAARAARDTESGWTGASADAARSDAGGIVADGDAIARALVLAAVAARDGARQIGAAQIHVAAVVEAARAEGFLVGDDGSVVPGAAPSTPLILLAGNDAALAAELLVVRAQELSRQVDAALNRLGDEDDDAAHDIGEAFASVDRRADLAAGNTDGLTWDVRIAANRTNIAQAIVDRLDDPDSAHSAMFYRGLLSEIDDPAGSGRRIDRKILAFDPARASLVELNGDLGTARSVAVLVPGMNTTIEGSATDTRTARQFVSASRGEVAAITYLGGRFPQGESIVGALVDAASPRFALDMAPRLVAFSQDVDATVDATGRSIPVTYVGHSYGGSILGTAEALGLTADRTVYVAAAGAGVGVDRPGEWHNRNPDVLRFSMTAPGDPIQLVQGLPGGPHGADPDEMRGVIHLATGHFDDGRLVAGPDAHTDVIDTPTSDAWRNILAVITGDREHIVVAS